MQRFPIAVTVLLASALIIGFRTTSAAENADDAWAPKTIRVSPASDVQYRLQEALINAVPGDVIELSAGTYHFDDEINIAADGLTIRGAGSDQTILSFKRQSAGGSGIVATGDDFLIEGLAVTDTVGNAVKVIGADGVTFRDLRTEWTAGPQTSNGAYGIYPVECRNVLIENCTAIAASDAGIYVGQSQHVIVRNCRAERNVAGIEIENTLHADVFDNAAVNNTGGILVFDLPGLNLSNGGYVRVFRNKVVNNNHDNFASKGSIVSEVPPGTGLMLMSTDNVEVFDNDITDNQTTNVIIVSYLITERKFSDPKYDPFPESVSIHDNRIRNGGQKPGGRLGTLIGAALGGRLPDIMFDGIVDPAKLVDGGLPQNLQLSLRNNSDASFTNVKAADLRPELLLTGKYQPETDASVYDTRHPSLPAVELQPPANTEAQPAPAVAVYRSAPQQLSEWKLFERQNGQLRPAADLIPYELNTPLFSDHTLKHRHIRLPKETQMQWRADGPLDFPTGTVITKTFAYPDDSVDATPQERYLETRIEFRKDTGWYGFSYVWNEDQTDAVLRLGGSAVDTTWRDETGADHAISYRIPNANQCISCHGQGDAFAPLGPTAANLNCPDPVQGKNQLQEWSKQGLIAEVPSQDQWPQMARFDHPDSGTVSDRARAWLDVNCAHCHNPAGSARTTGLDLRLAQSTPAKFGVFKSPVAAGKGTGGRMYDIVPGKPDESILMYRLETSEPGERMPSLARTLNHDPSNQLIRRWIAEMQELHP